MTQFQLFESIRQEVEFLGTKGRKATNICFSNVSASFGQVNVVRDLSTEAFKIAMDQIKHFVNHEDMFFYVDDVAMIFVLDNRDKKVDGTNELSDIKRDEIQERLNELVECADYYGLSVSHVKSKMIKFTRRHDCIRIK